MLCTLTRRESQVARAIGIDCLTAKDAAARLGIAPRTVEVHRDRIYDKLGITRGIAELARMMAIHGPQCEGRG